MGVYLCVERGGGPHPEWTFGLAGDRELANFVTELPRLFRHEPAGPEDYPGDMVEERDFRPADFGVWRLAERAGRPWPHNPGRLLQLIELLESDPEAWVHVSW